MAGGGDDGVLQGWSPGRFPGSSLRIMRGVGDPIWTLPPSREQCWEKASSSKSQQWLWGKQPENLEGVVLVAQSGPQTLEVFLEEEALNGAFKSGRQLGVRRGCTPALEV